MAFVMGTKRLRKQTWTSFSSFMAVEETVEMLKHPQYTEYTQFYSSISPIYGLKIFQV